MSLEHPFLNIQDEINYQVERDRRMSKLSSVPSTTITAPTSAAVQQKVAGAFQRADDKFKIPLICARSGIRLGDFVPSVGLAVATPYVQNWKENTFLHPIFSLSFSSLVSRAEACWNLEKSGTRSFPAQHKQLLFLAMLHASGCIKQDVPALPSIKLVETHFPRLLELLGWKYETNSDRVSFPKLHVWKGAGLEDEHDVFSNLPSWLDVVEACKDEYENVARERRKAAKQKAHDLALKSIRRAMYSDVSLKRLWGWFGAQVPQIILENNADLEQLFFTTEDQINVWTPEDIEALEGLFLKHCEIGTSVSHEFSKRIKQLASWLQLYKDTFEIVEPEEERFSEYRGIPRPEAQNFPNRAAFLVARAKWDLANKPVEQKEEGDDL